ncbi:MAG: phosphate acyltransferase [Solirubrobacteraceae bacterium]|nr:phosphate acyltransferase [Solirubrobacteraceae bacterium]
MASLTIALDANGSDHGPGEVARGAALAVAADPDLRVLLFGPAGEMDAADRVEIVDAPLSVAKAADPVAAVREQPDASIVQAVQAVADDRADALVSGGSTAAALAAGVFRIKRARGVHRPALALLLPVPSRPFLLLDAGANVDVRPEHLVQFAHMGAAFAQAVLGIETPRVALLSNGTEATKGTDAVLAAHEKLLGMPGFAGNVEGFTVASGDADVVVTDGFTGNVMLKTMEGTMQALLEAIRAAAMSSPRSKAGGLLLRPALGGLRDELDPELQGGAVLLGLRKLGVVPHGSFTARGIATAVAVAARGVRHDLVGRTHAALEAAGALRRAPVASGAEARVDSS